MQATLPKLITAEEFGRMPEPEDGSRLELVNGVIETITPPRGRHGYVCLEVGSLLRGHVKPNGLGWVTSNDTGFVVSQDPDTVRGPDVAFWSKERLPSLPEEYIDIPPDLAVEVLSPSDTASRQTRKLRDYAKAGVAVVWVIDPELRIVTIYHGSADGRTLEEGETLEGEGPLAGFRCRVAELFI